jgi:DnaJ domain
MPRPQKPKFDDFYGIDRPVVTRGCDYPGCPMAGEYRAPKSPDRLREFHMFCLDHVREYNAAWDYNAGLGPEDIEQRIRDAAVWERPTWPFRHNGNKEQQWRQKIFDEFFPGEDHGFDDPPRQPTNHFGEKEALLALGLTPPVAFSAIKAQYRLLVKKHHPDALASKDEKEQKEAEEKLKSINQAFTTLKAFYEANNTTEKDTA